MEYFDTRDYDLAGRIGKLKTKHGIIETPYLFPVIDPIRQQPSLETIRSLGFNGIITNAYLFYRRNKGLPKKIHDSLKWNNTIMTDSGGYQVLIYGDVEVDNKTIVEYEKKIGTDIAVILDIPTGIKMSWEEARQALFETNKRAVEALPYIMDSDQLWVFPVQGSPYKDLLLISTSTAWRLPYHINAFGSPTVLLEKYEYDKILDLVGFARLHLPPHKPLHVFGVGHPMIIPFLVALGGDLFDSASYILYARDNRYMTETGTKKLEELHYLPCNCPVCSKYTVKELLEMPRKKRVEYLALHNLYMLRKEINNVKQAIKEGRLWEYLEYKSKSHPTLRKAFEIVKKYTRYLEKYNPETKGTTHALLLIDKDSHHNPRLIRIKRKVYGMLSNKKLENILLIPAYKKPYNQQIEYIEAKRKYHEYTILFYHPYLGVFPPQLANTYPYFQHEVGIIDKEVITKASKEILQVINKLRPKKIIIVQPVEEKYYLLTHEIIKWLRTKTTYTLDVLSFRT